MHRIKSDHVFQFKVTLKGIRPPIWRRILVPSDYTFWDLHVAIQDAMGWLDCHLHLFRKPTRGVMQWLEIGIPGDEGWDEYTTVPGWEIFIAQIFTLAERKMVYQYDFGDGWEHDVVLEKVFPRDKSVRYPVCTGGRRACPPEDCGGIPGYHRFCEAITDPAHPEHDEMLEWVGRAFDPDHFDQGEVHFDDPDQRWNFAFGPESPGGVPAEMPGIHAGGDALTELAGMAEVVDMHGRPITQGRGPAGRSPSIENQSMHSPLGTGQGNGWDEAVEVMPQPVRQLLTRARQPFQGFPVATVVLYGPDDRHATKVAVAILASENAEPEPLSRWLVEEGDIREKAVIGEEILAFIQENAARTVIVADRILGCPHEEGIDYPEGAKCPQCPFWARHDRWTGEPIQ